MNNLIPGGLRIRGVTHIVGNILTFSDSGTVITITRVDSSTLTVDSATDPEAYESLSWWLKQNVDLVEDYILKKANGYI